METHNFIKTSELESDSKKSTGKRRLEYSNLECKSMNGFQDTRNSNQLQSPGHQISISIISVSEALQY